MAEEHSGTLSMKEKSTLLPHVKETIFDFRILRAMKEFHDFFSRKKGGTMKGKNTKKEIERRTS